MQQDNVVKNEFDRLVANDPARMLRPEAIVGAATDPSSPLHPYFTWDDDEAAHRWRLEQARHLIKNVQVYIEPLNIRVRAYTSLDLDRESNGGWRSMTDVMANADLRASMLMTALRELQGMQSRYTHLEELASVWEAANGVNIIVSKPKRKAKAKVAK